jgi:Asp-tRNA(Asn)/Glu-tRNA(Gln) amidotransferase A subunit family amidase
MAFRLLEATIESAHAALQAGEISSRDLVQRYLDRIAAYDQQGLALNAIQTVNPRALAEADALDAALRTSGLTGPLHGIPVLLKDQAETMDLPTTYGSALFRDFVPTRNATVVERLKAAGAVIIAKNTMSEYALPGFHGSAFGFCRNAYDQERIPGGSSCGSGASVAANLGLVGIGEDTGGSIRNPASYNALVGVRPTVGLISRFGLLPGTPTRDTMGPMTRTVRDAAILLDVLAGFDGNDPATGYSVGHIPDTYTAFLTPDGLHGKRLGVIREPIGASTDPSAADYHEIWQAIEQALRDMAALGAEIVDAVPAEAMIRMAQRPIGGGESEAALDRYFEAHANAPVHTLREIVLSAEGMVLPSQRAQLAEKLGQSTRDYDYLTSLLVREELRQEVLRVMGELRLDALVYPTTNHSPARIPDDVLTSTMTRSTSGSNGALSSVTAFPTLTVPSGYTSEGLPIGLSFFGRPFTEGPLLQLAYAYEQATHHREPPKATPALAGEPTA